MKPTRPISKAERDALRTMLCNGVTPTELRMSTGRGFRTLGKIVRVDRDGVRR